MWSNHSLAARRCASDSASSGFKRVVDDDEVGAAPGQDAADTGGEPTALRRRVEFRHRLPRGREPRRKDAAVPGAGDDAPAIARQFVGELLGIRGAQDLQARRVPEAPGRKGDRGQQRLQMPRRQVDDQPADPAVAHRRELRCDQLDMPAECQFGLRIELAKEACAKLAKSTRSKAAISSAATLCGCGISIAFCKWIAPHPGPLPASGARVIIDG